MEIIPKYKKWESIALELGIRTLNSEKFGNRTENQDFAILELEMKGWVIDKEDSTSIWFYNYDKMMGIRVGRSILDKHNFFEIFEKYSKNKK